MTKSIKMWLLGIFSLCFLLPVKAPQPQDSIRFSLLTCAPGSEIYALFGHTALRYQNFSDQTDLVFNYGMFSFNTPHFVFPLCEMGRQITSWELRPILTLSRNMPCAVRRFMNRS